MPAGHPAATAHLAREHLPGQAAAKDEEDAGERGAVRQPRPPPRARALRRRRQERLDYFPEHAINQLLRHAASIYAQAFLLEALSRAEAFFLCEVSFIKAPSQFSWRYALGMPGA